MKLNFWQIIGLILILSYGAWTVYSHFNPDLKQGTPPTTSPTVSQAK